jgi:hypothetical protein
MRHALRSMPESEAYPSEARPGQVFAGRSRAVAGTDRALDDPTVIRERSWLAGPEPEPQTTASVSARASVIVLLAVLAMLVAALGLALAAR